MPNNDPTFGNEKKIQSDTVSDYSFSVDKDDEEHYETEGISPLENYYISPGKKRISKEIKKLDNIETKRLKSIRSILTEAQTSYTVDYVKQLIKLARYYSKELLDFELSIEKENTYLVNVRDLSNCEYGKVSSRIEEIVDTVKFIQKLEERLENKGIIQKETVKEKAVNRIARKAGDSK